MKNFNLLKSAAFVTMSIIPTFIGLFLAILSTGAGHGDYLFAKLIFPYSMLLSISVGEITPIFIIIALMQFSVYAFILSLVESRKRILQIALLVLGIHISFFVLCFIAPGSSF